MPEDVVPIPKFRPSSLNPTALNMSKPLRSKTAAYDSLYKFPCPAL
jgi:hypothetical protein